MNRRIADEQAFQIHLDQNPEDQSLRLIYLDWLEEKRDPRADIVRQLMEVQAGQRENVDCSNPLHFLSALRTFISPVTRVDTLSDFQERLLPIFCDIWIQVGQSTEETDKSETETALKYIYEETGNDLPEITWWGQSPIQGATRAKDFQRKGSAVSRACELLDRVIKKNSHVSLQAELREKLWQPVFEIVGMQIRSPLWEVVHQHIIENCQDSYDARLCHFGLHDAAHLAVCSFYYYGCGLRSLRNVEELCRLGLQCGWLWAWKDSIILTEKPEELLMDRNGLQYIRYSDGFSIDRRKREGRFSFFRKLFRRGN